MKKIILFLLLFCALKIQAQNYIYQGDTKYASTPTWKLSINGTSWGKALYVAVGKNGNEGILMVSTEVPTDEYIGGDIYIFLSDGTRITCTDKKIRDNVDNKAIALYKFSAEEIEKLKKQDIASIRFTIEPAEGGGFFGNKTASFESKYSYSRNIVSTSTDIQALFKSSY